MKTLYLMVGVPGSGKSTWIKNRINYEKEVWVSRDAIRFAILEDGEPYFSHEKQVFGTFVRKIREALADGHIEAVYADATHLNAASRMKLLRRLNLEDVAVIPVVFLTPLETCIERNNTRMGRARVDVDVIKDMTSSLTMPERSGREINYRDIIEIGKVGSYE